MVVLGGWLFLICEVILYHPLTTCRESERDRQRQARERGEKETTGYGSLDLDGWGSFCNLLCGEEKHLASTHDSRRVQELTKIPPHGGMFVAPS